MDILKQLLEFLTILAGSYTWWQMLVFFVLSLVFIMAIYYKRTKPIWQWIGHVFSGRRLKRSCKDCVALMGTLREKFIIQCDKLSSSILRTQMTFAEHKLEQIELLTVREFDKLWAAEKANLQGVEDVVGEILKQQKLFLCVLRETIHIMRDEIRRSFKENGFYDMGEEDFSHYLKDRVRVLNTIMCEHFRSVYPPAESMVVSPEALQTIFDKIQQDFTEIVRDIYKNASGTRRNTLASIAVLEVQFQKDLDKIYSGEGE